MAHALAEAGPSNTGVSRFIVRSTDVIQDMRVNVYAENAEEKVIWYKERFLGDDEIVENIVHNQTSTICWTIHRPKRGWYIRIRSPIFPPGVFIPLIPVPQNAPYHADAALSFTSRTNDVPDGILEEADGPSQFTIDDDDDATIVASSSTASIHSYPPTPTAAVIVSPPSPKSVQASLAKVKQKRLRPRASHLTQFVLAPHSTQPQVQPPDASFFARALSVLKSHRPSHSNSFTLSRVPVVAPGSPPPPYASDISLVGEAARSTVALAPPVVPLHSPLLVFHDRTPVYTVRSLTGLIEIDRAEERHLGVDTSFWIAVALTYLEFLEERESYFAALGD